MTDNKYIDAGDRWVAITDDRGNWSRKRVELQKQMPSLKARIAIDIASRYGLIATGPDGEDTAGRAILREMTVEQVVERAVAIADEVVNAITDKGWMLDMPHPSEIYDSVGDTE